MEISRAFSVRPPEAFGLIEASARAASADSSRSVESAKSTKDVGRERVGELVGNLFYGTLLKEMNQSSLRGELFHGGRGEEAFQGQLVQHLAERIGRSKNEPMSNAIYQSIQRRQGSWHRFPTGEGRPVEGGAA